MQSPQSSREGCGKVRHPEKRKRGGICFCKLLSATPPPQTSVAHTLNLPPQRPHHYRRCPGNLTATITALRGCPTAPRRRTAAPCLSPSSRPIKKLLFTSESQIWRGFFFFFFPSAVKHEHDARVCEVGRASREKVSPRVRPLECYDGNTEWHLPLFWLRRAPPLCFFARDRRGPKSVIAICEHIFILFSQCTVRKFRVVG